MSNETDVKNTPPSAPSGLNTHVEGSKVTLSWLKLRMTELLQRTNIQFMYRNYSGWHRCSVTNVRSKNRKASNC